MLTNPYVAGNPVGGSSAFVGRADVLRSVLRVLKNPGENAIVLYGQRRIGKTSLLHELRQRLPSEGAYHPVYFDLQDKAALPLAAVLSQLQERIAHEIKLPTLPNEKGDLVSTFRQQFLPAVRNHLPKSASLVLLFDEFDVLDNPGDAQAGAAFFPYLRDLLTFDPRLQFVFVIGRRPEDLSSLTLSIFKGVKSERVSLLSSEDCAQLVRLSETNQSLFWSEATVAHVQKLTGGHPFLTQQLCQEIWEEANEGEPSRPPTMQPKAVDAALANTLKRSTNALEWLWNGLGAAQRIVASALAEAGEQAITQEELESRLQKSGVRILVGELQDAPKLLQDWDIIEPVGNPEKPSYRFRVELLRRWIAERKPLRQVQQEIDRIQPAAENLFQAAYQFYQNGQLKDAVPLLRQAIGLNPNHARATLLLAELLLAQNEVDEARQLLETLYQYQPAAARPRLIQALLEQLRLAKSDEQRLPLLGRILELEPNHSDTRNERVQIWLRQLEIYDKSERYSDALNLAYQLAEELPSNHPQQPNLKLIERKTQLSHLYNSGVDALKKNDLTNAVRQFIEVITLQPDFGEATYYLHLAVTGEDRQKLRLELTNEKELRERTERALRKNEKALMIERKDYSMLELQLEELDRQLKTLKQIQLDNGRSWQRFLGHPFIWIVVGILVSLLLWRQLFN